MKRLILVLTVLALLVSPTLARADVVWGNEFEGKHRDQLVELDRHSFTVNAPDGYVIAQLEPGQSEEVIPPGAGSAAGGYDEGTPLPRFENGAYVTLSSAILHNGVYWGVMQTSHSSSIVGWIPMDYLLITYTPQDFLDANSDAIIETEVQIAPQDTEGVVLWLWPGSDQVKRTLEAIDSEPIRTRFLYLDPEGREWGYAPSIFNGGFGSNGYISGWICLDDPTNSSDIPAFNPAPTPQVWSPDTSLDWTDTGGDYPAPPLPIEETPGLFDTPLFTAVLIIAIVAIVAGLTITGIMVYKKSRKHP